MTSNQLPGWKEGDRVISLDKTIQGVVIEVSPSGRSLTVRWGNAGVGHVRPSDVRKLDPQAR